VTSAIEVHLAATQARISRVDAPTAAAMQRAGALLVDTRCEALRAADGEIPEAIVIERNVLEWRLEPTSAHRHPAVVGHEGPIVVFCQEGYASSLAVASLSDLGLHDVHDLAGGFEAWRAAGLPVRHRSAG
jgi:rhodanese-related sulfurtransferase